VILRDRSSRRYATHFTNTNKLSLFRHFHTFFNFHHDPLALGSFVLLSGVLS
jgi:hypothetical protein